MKKRKFSSKSSQVLSGKDKRAAFEMDSLGWIIVGIIVLVVVVLGLFVLKDKGIGAMSYLNNLFKFGK